MRGVGDGLCECGCGGKTRIATHTHKANGHIRGKPVAEGWKRTDVAAAYGIAKSYLHHVVQGRYWGTV